MRSLVVFDASSISWLTLATACQDAYQYQAQNSGQLTQVLVVMFVNLKIAALSPNLQAAYLPPAQALLAQAVAQLKDCTAFDNVEGDLIYTHQSEINAVLLARLREWRTDVAYLNSPSDNSAYYAPKILAGWRRWIHPQGKQKKPLELAEPTFAVLSLLEPRQLLAKAACQLVLIDQAAMIVRLHYLPPVKISKNSGEDDFDKSIQYSSLTVS